MRQSITLIMLVGLSTLLACVGTQSSDGEETIDKIQITTERINEIADVEWHLQSMKIDNQSVALIPDTKNTFTCDEGGKVAGVAAINRYFGSFRFREDGSVIWNRAFGMTRMAGPPELMDQEAKFMQALPRTSRIYVKNENLFLISADRSTVLEFKKIK